MQGRMQGHMKEEEVEEITASIGMMVVGPPST